MRVGVLLGAAQAAAVGGEVEEGGGLAEGLADGLAWYARYRVISHSRARGVSDVSAGSGSGRQVQAAMRPAPGWLASGWMKSVGSVS